MIILFHLIFNYTKLFWQLYIERRVDRELKVLFETNCKTETFEKYENRNLNIERLRQTPNCYTEIPSHNLQFESSDDNGHFFNSSDLTLDFDRAFYHEGKIRFNPPVYQQRYLVVAHMISNAKWNGKIKKVVEFGCAEISLLNYLKVIDGITEICVVDIDEEILNRNILRIQPWFCDSFNYRRTVPLTVKALHGSVSHPDHHLKGVDAVIAIELIEHMYPAELSLLPVNIFGYIKPRVAIFTTPNSDFNVLFDNFSGFRHDDHKFEWSRKEFQAWANDICQKYPEYEVYFFGIGLAPEGRDDLGCCSQGAVFLRLPIDEDQLITCDELNTSAYKLIDSADFPVTEVIPPDVRTLNDAANYFRICERVGDFEKDYKTVIPLSSVLPRVYNTCKSTKELRRILEEKYKIEENSDGEEVVVYTGESEGSDSNSGLSDHDLLENEDLKTSDDVTIGDANGWEQVSNCSWKSGENPPTPVKSASDASDSDPGDLKEILNNLPPKRLYSEIDFINEPTQESTDINVFLEESKSLETIVSVSDENYESSNASSESRAKISATSVMDSDDRKSAWSSDEFNHSTNQKQPRGEFPSDNNDLFKTKSLQSTDLEHSVLPDEYILHSSQSNDPNGLQKLSIHSVEQYISPMTVRSLECCSSSVDEENLSGSHSSGSIKVANGSKLVCDEGNEDKCFEVECNSESDISRNCTKLPASVQFATASPQQPLIDVEFASDKITEDMASCKLDCFKIDRKPGGFFESAYNTANPNRQSEQTNRASSLDLDTEEGSASVENLGRSFSSDGLIITSDCRKLSLKSMHEHCDEIGENVFASDLGRKVTRVIEKHSNPFLGCSETSKNASPDQFRRFSSSSFIYKSQSQEKIEQVYSFRTIPIDKRSGSDIATDRRCLVGANDSKDVDGSLHKCHSAGKISHEFTPYYSPNDGFISMSCADKLPSSESNKELEFGRERRCMSVSCIGNINVDGDEEELSTMEERDQQNSCSPDKFGPDSGYPNSNSGLDMEMDTPEQVREIMTESESSFDESPLESPVADNAPIVHPPVIPVGENVENGDVANNNRDGEGNNMVGPGIVGDALEFRAIIEEHEGNLPLMEAAACNAEQKFCQLLDEACKIPQSICESGEVKFCVELAQDNFEKEAETTNVLPSETKSYFEAPADTCEANSSAVFNNEQSDPIAPLINPLETNNNSNDTEELSVELVDDTEELSIEHVDDLLSLVPLSLFELTLNSSLRDFAEEILSQLESVEADELFVFDAQYLVEHGDHHDRLLDVENIETLDQEGLAPRDFKGGGDSATENV